MEITKFVVSSRNRALLDGDYAAYRAQLSGRLLNSRKKLGIATKNRGKYHHKGQVTPEQVAENNEYLYLQLLTVERAWAHAMAMKTAHAADTKGISGRTRSHIASRLDKAARTAETLAKAVSQTEVSGAGSTDVLEVRAYASLLKGATQFEKQSWEPCLKSYSTARIIYSALSTAAKRDIYADLLTETIDPSIRYAAYRLKIPRTQPIPAIARRAFPASDVALVDALEKLNPDALKYGDVDAKSGSAGAPKTLTWRSREVQIEDAAIADAWASIQTAKAGLVEKLSAPNMQPEDMVAAYDDVLTASQDAVDATKQAIDDLRGEGVSQSDPRMQSLQITRTAVNYETISWRIGRNRVMTGENDGATMEQGTVSKRRAAKGQSATRGPAEEPLSRQVTKLKEKVVLYDGTLQSIESIRELPGVAADEGLSAQLDATSKYFSALKCLALARSYLLAGKAANALALMQHAFDQCDDSIQVLSKSPDDPQRSPLNIKVSKKQVQFLHNILKGELQRCRALVEIGVLRQPTNAASGAPGKPLVERLAEYPSDGVDLENIVVYPPKMEPIPVKPLFLDVAWNYIEYPSIHEEPKSKGKVAEKVAKTEEEPRPQKRGWFGFGR